MLPKEDHLLGDPCVDGASIAWMWLKIMSEADDELIAGMLANVWQIHEGELLREHGANVMAFQAAIYVLGEYFRHHGDFNRGARCCQRTVEEWVEHNQPGRAAGIREFFRLGITTERRATWLKVLKYTAETYTTTMPIGVH